MKLLRVCLEGPAGKAWGEEDAGVEAEGGQGEVCWAPGDLCVKQFEKHCCETQEKILGAQKGRGKVCREKK